MCIGLDWRALDHGWRALDHGWRALDHGWRALDHDWRALDHGWHALDHGWRALDHGWFSELGICVHFKQYDINWWNYAQSASYLNVSQLVSVCCASYIAEDKSGSIFSLISATLATRLYSSIYGWFSTSVLLNFSLFLYSIPPHVWSPALDGATT